METHAELPDTPEPGDPYKRAVIFMRTGGSTHKEYRKSDQQVQSLIASVRDSGGLWAGDHFWPWHSIIDIEVRKTMDN